MRKFTTLLENDYDKFINEITRDYSKFLTSQNLEDTDTSQIIYLEICLRDYVPRLIESKIQELERINSILKQENAKLAVALMQDKTTMRIN